MSTVQVANLHFESTANNRIQYAGSNTLIAYAAGVEQWRANTSGLFFANTTQVKADLGTPSIESMAIHNLSKNGGMEVSQENSNTAANTTNYYPVDERRYNVTGFDCDVWQSTEVPSNNYKNSLAVSVQVQDVSVGATDVINLQEKLEGTMTNKLGLGTADASSITVGFWSRCSSDLTYSYAMRSSGTDYSFLKELSLTGNTWTWNCFTIPGTTNGTWYSNTSIGMYQDIALTMGSTFANATANSWISGNYLGTTTQDNFAALGVGNTFHTTGWVMLPGEHTISSSDAYKFLLPYDYELQRCQRYYQNGNGQQYKYWNVTPAVGSFNPDGIDTFSFPTIMRATPSISRSGVTDTAGTVTLAGYTNGFRMVMDATSGTGAFGTQFN